MSPRRQYDAAIAALHKDPDSLVHMHQAVLALARAGSLVFALREYARYGLNKVHHDEDIMALGGRLYKDLYLSASGSEARDFALESAAKYEAAFKETGGYYSGINAATMAWLGGVPDQIAHKRAERMLEILPSTVSDDRDDRYFVEATKAEARLLLGQELTAQSALRNAWDHDPLNYTAHASTLKQLQMIAAKMSHPLDWLDGFSPPQTVHFAGYMFSDTMPESDMIDLKRRVTDSIQRHDLGFGYGALAAGSDILIAEALLEEGAELNIVLPTSRASFVDTSVLPYGSSWVERFDRCWDQAASHYELSSASSWPSDERTSYASALSMGKAIRRGDGLSVSAFQLLICNADDRGSQTAADASLWAEFGRGQDVIPFQVSKKPSLRKRTSFTDRLEFIVVGTDHDEMPKPLDLEAALSLARRLRADAPETISLGIHAYLAGDTDAISTARSLYDLALPGDILLSETAANLTALMAYNDCAVSYVGLTSNDSEAFALRFKTA